MTATFLPGRASLLAASHQFPEQYLSNEQLLTALEQLSGKRFARVAARIVPFLGIEGRHFSRSIHSHVSEPTPTNSELTANTLKDLLANSQHTLADIDYLIGHTTTPDTQLPPSIAWVAEKLRYQGPFMELRQACTGFSSTLQIAIPRLAMLNKPIAIVGSETGSVYFDYEKGFLDQSQLVNYMQMGDGAGGVIIGPETSQGMGTISHCFTGQIGVDRSPGLSLDGGSASVYTQTGKARFHHSATDVRKSGEALFQASILALRSHGFELDKFDYIIPHQASGRIDSLLADTLDIDPDKIINDAKRWGNLGSAAIWCSFSSLVHSGKLESGSKVVILGAEATKYMYGGFVYTHNR
ncbi:3-oxoacyl-[acyl-carrier-protein] synthase 3 [Vibrio thalassae]|uniref:3-oxoacyl-[acyl-carrier-protein] synthase 3 n=1 Tax=Vibrio thalassae TaxID=1243014 RepID=A0A240ELH2_9VIBR|nr:3-oxoacyl-[acyl-carrier-protein] synthase III C-terminal domain-containing protein [Vibrio thalassae]SNX49351.1 3-oxoacyl-[acyl-carrier-protein] synthase 3 [Vibrio thalassae]